MEKEKQYAHQRDLTGIAAPGEQGGFAVDDEAGFKAAADFIKANRDEGTYEEESRAERQHQIRQIEPEEQCNGQPTNCNQRQTIGKAGSPCGKEVVPTGTKPDPWPVQWNPSDLRSWRREYGDGLAHGVFSPSAGELTLECGRGL